MQHSISDIDVISARGYCSSCGPDTPIYKQSRRKNNGEFSYGCSVRKRNYARVNKQNPGTYGTGIPGLNRAQAAKLIEEAGRCAICYKTTDLCVDHCHETDVIRGILCGNCNRGLGLFFDNPTKLASAIKYLQK